MKRISRKILKDKIEDYIKYCQSHIISIDHIEDRNDLIRIDKNRVILFDEIIDTSIDNITQNMLSWTEESNKIVEKGLKDSLAYITRNSILNGNIKNNVEDYIYYWTNKKRHRITYYFKLKNIIGPSKKINVSKYIFINKACKIKRLKDFIRISKANISSDAIHIKLKPQDTIIAVTILSKHATENLYNKAIKEAKKVVNIINFYFCFDKSKVYLINFENSIPPTFKPTAFVSSEEESFCMMRSKKQTTIYFPRSWQESNQYFWLKCDELKDIENVFQLFNNMLEEKSEIGIKFRTAFNIIGDAIRNENRADSFLQIMIALDLLLSQESDKIKKRRILLSNDKEIRLLSKNKANNKVSWKKTQIADIVSYIISLDSENYKSYHLIYLKLGEIRDRIVHDGKRKMNSNYYKILLKTCILFMEEILSLFKFNSNIKTTDDLWIYCHDYLFKKVKNVGSSVIADQVEITDTELLNRNPIMIAKRALKINK